MNQLLIRLGYCLKSVLFLISIAIIYYYRMNAIIEQTNSNDYIPANCQIVETIREKVNCSMKTKLCEKLSYGIIYGEKQFLRIDRLPTWFSPYDKVNLQGYPNIFQGEILLKGMNISCYYYHSDIQWSEPNSYLFIYSASFSCFVLFIIMLHSFQDLICQIE